MGLPGRRTRERIQSTDKQTECPCCGGEASVSLEKRRAIMRVDGGGETRLVAEDFDGDPDEDVRVETTETECPQCGETLTVYSSYQPR